jgi:integrase
MVTIREKRPGYWEVRAFVGRDERGKPVQVSRVLRGTKRDARRFAAQLSLAPASRSGEQVNVAELLELWFEHAAPSWAPSTLRDQRTRIRAINKDAIASAKLARLTVADVDRWHARLARRGVREGSVRNQHQALRAALSLAQRWGWVTTNVVAIARLKARKTTPRGSLTSEEVRRVLRAIDALVEAAEVERAASVALRLAAVTGARRSELAALRWADLDHGRLTIDSSISVLRRAAQTGGRPTLRDDPTKTGNRRIVTLDERTLEAVEALRVHVRAECTWLLAVGERPVSPDRVSAWWRRARDLAGIAPTWRLHDLRHWAATTSIASGHDVRTVADRLGHADPSMTLRVYAHAVEGADASLAATLAIELLDDTDRAP